MALPVEPPAEVPDAMVDRLEHHVRRLGIPLPAAEAVVSDLEAAERFLAACEAGRGRAYAARRQGRDPEDDAADDPTRRVRIVEDPPHHRGSRREDRGSAATRQA
jgi:hypothetical protein